jgi:hypothetical protein
MEPRPLHISDESSNNIDTKDDLIIAKKRFHANISNGIQAIVKQGYSRARAAHLILEQIRQSDAQPQEDQVFRVMHHLGLGIEAATQTIIVANALKRVQEKRGFTSSHAIDYLSSCLTTMKLLGSVEKTASVQSSPASALTHVDIDSPSISSTVTANGAGDSSSITISAQTNSSSSSSSSSASTSSDSVYKNSLPLHPKSITRRASKSMNNLKNLKRQSKPPKPQRKRKEDETDDINANEKNNTNVDAKVAEKVLLVKEQEVQSRTAHGAHCKTPSPNVARHSGKRVGAHNRGEHDLNMDFFQPVPDHPSI